jgi:hypothetical protein
MAATASDADGSISRVEFYNGGTLLATDTSSPYSYTWSNVAAGSYTITAIAQDNAGTRTTSSARTITVSSSTPSNQAPTVSLTSPSSGASASAPAAFTVSANASDADGTIARVDFYQGSVQIGSDTTSPYSITWSNVAAGTYSIMAVARDNAGATTSSSARTVVVNGASMPDTAAFAPSSNHATAVTSYLLEVFTSGANPVTANPMASQNLGKPSVVNGEITADVGTTVNGLPSGSYVATVTAIGPGGQVQSAASPAFSR